MKMYGSITRFWVAVAETLGMMREIDAVLKFQLF